MQAYCQSVFSSLPVLDTKRLRLRPLSMRDEKDMYRYASDPAVSRHRYRFSVENDRSPPATRLSLHKPDQIQIDLRIKTLQSQMFPPSDPERQVLQLS